MHELEERYSWHEISTDKGKTWTRQFLTPTEVLAHKMLGYATRPLDWHASLPPCSFCETSTRPSTQEVVVSGPWVAICKQVDEDGNLRMFAEADDYTDYYYPKFCPECGRQLKTKP